jgi:hypothetical protein
MNKTVLTDEELRRIEVEFRAERVRSSDEEYLLIYQSEYWQWQRAIEQAVLAKLEQRQEPVAFPEGYEIHELPVDYTGPVWIEGQVRGLYRLATAHQDAIHDSRGKVNGCAESRRHSATVQRIQ